MPNPKQEAEYVLKFVRYHQQRNYQAYQSHRKRRLKELNQQIHAYRVDPLPPGDSARPVFEFAKALNIPLIIAPADPANGEDYGTVAYSLG